MSIYLVSSIPNAWFPNAESDLVMTVTGLNMSEVIELICNINYSSCSDSIATLMLKDNVISCVAHSSMTEKISHSLWEYAPVYDDYGNPLFPKIPTSKKQITPADGDIVVGFLNIIKDPTRPIKKGDIYAPSTRWVRCDFYEVF